jgi:N6-L-threonylcarbamoyladenine synthase
MDDAAGECFDKIARMLWGPYPWGKWIDDLAQLGNPDAWYQFRAGSVDGQPLLFSYSGIKSQVHNLIHKLWDSLDEQTKADIALAFQNAVCQDLLSKLELASHQYHTTTIGIVWGVSACRKLKEINIQKQMDIIYPKKFVYCTDNAAMIGVAGLINNSF